MIWLTPADFETSRNKVKLIPLSTLFNLFIELGNKLLARLIFLQLGARLVVGPVKREAKSNYRDTVDGLTKGRYHSFLLVTLKFGQLHDYHIVCPNVFCKRSEPNLSI